MKCNGVIGLAARFVGLYLLLLAVFTLSVWGAYRIPAEAVRDNVAASEAMIIADQRADVSQPDFIRPDYFTDGLMYGMTVTGNDSAGAFSSAMLNRFYYCDSIAPAVTGLHLASDSVSEESVHIYGRYWHGYIAPLKVLSLFMTLHGIRILNYLLLGLLFFVCLSAIWRHRGAGAAFAFLTSMTSTAVFVMPGCLQYSSCLYITLGGVLTAVTCTSRLRRNGNVYLLFFAIGALTAFFDLLTAPLMTLGYALALYLYRTDIADKYRTAALICVAWAAGYAALWASKWLLVYIFTDFDIFADAMDAAAVRIAETVTWHPHFVTHRVLPAYLIAMAVTVALPCVFGGRLSAVRSNGWLLAIALLPLAWMALLVNHSTVHYFFVWRIEGITLLCCILYFFSSIRPRFRQ